MGTAIGLRTDYTEADLRKAAKRSRDAHQVRRLLALAAVCDWLECEGWAVQTTTESPITGGDGNVEFLLWAKMSG